jgi:hypothetical protein
MRILFRIAVGMMHPVHDAIGAWHEEGRALYKPCAQVKNTFPVPGGGVHLMRGKPVQEKGMKEQRKEPMKGKEQQNCKHEAG